MSSRIVSLVSHAVGDFRAYSKGVGAGAVPSDQDSVPALGYGKGLDCFMGAIQLFLDSVPPGSGNCLESNNRVCH